MPDPIPIPAWSAGRSRQSPDQPFDVIDPLADSAPEPRDAAAAVNDGAVRSGLELMQRNTRTMQHALQCGARLATRLSERSAGHVGRAVGLSGAIGEDADWQSAQNFGAIVQSGAVMAEIIQCLCEEWAEIARARLDRSFDRFDALQQCRTPQEVAALHTEIMRDNLETIICYAHRAGERSARIARRGAQA
jgi:hypothetical protein